MVDINLLPNELRGREEAERKRLSKTPKVVEITLTNPAKSASADLPHGGSGVGRPQPPKRPLPPPPESTLPPPPRIPLPSRPELLRFVRPHLFGRSAPAAKVVTAPPVKIPAPPPLPKTSVRPLDAAEAARLSEIVKREVRAVGPRTMPGLPQRPKHHRRTFGQWISGLFARKPKPVSMPKLLPPEVKVVIKLPAPKSAPLLLLPKPKRHRRSFWQWLKGLFARKPKPLSMPKILPKPVPLPSLPPKPLIITVVKPPLPPPPVSVVPPRPLPPTPPVPVVPPSPVQKKPSAPVLPPLPPKPLPKQAEKPGKTVERPVKTLAINLIPEEFARHPELNLSRKFLVYLLALGVSAFAVLVVGQIIGLYQYWIGNEIRQTEQINVQYRAQIDDYQATLTEAQALQQELLTMQQLLGAHRYWTRVFDALQKVTIDEVYFTSFSSASDGSLELSAHGRDYESVARQLVAFQQATDVIATVSITGASAILDQDTGQVGEVGFAVSLRLRPEVFFIPLTSPQP